ncbi:hypothetical protein BH10PSE12_BH10PSE12_09230 [soil metagenome]
MSGKILAFGAGLAIVTIGAQSADLAHAADRTPPRALGKLMECRSIADASARLACFDTQVAAIEAATANDEVVILDREDVKQTRRSLFGFSFPKLPFLSDDKDDGSSRSKDAPSTIEAKIASARSLGYGKWMFKLDDGAQWETTEAIPSRQPSAGMPIVIKKAAIGSFMGKVNGWQPVRMKRTG